MIYKDILKPKTKKSKIITVALTNINIMIYSNKYIDRCASNLVK